MKIKTLELFPMGENCYIINDDNNNAAVIDPGSADSRIIEYIDRSNLNLRYILLTHGHFDHIMGVKMLLKEFPEAKTVIGSKDLPMLKDSNLNASDQIGRPFCLEGADITVKEGDEIALGDIRFKVIDTPGHTAGGVCYLCDNALFCGDTLFCGSIGRTDLPTGDFNALEGSIRNKLYKLDENTEVFCGHGGATTIKNEKLSNSFFRG